MTLCLGKALRKRLLLKRGSVSARQKLHHQATSFPREEGGNEDHPRAEVGDIISVSLANAGKHP